MERVIWIPILVLVVLATGCMPLAARAILGPITRAVGLDAPTRFQLSDVLWLLVLLQAALAVAVQSVGLDSYGFSIILGFLLFAVTALWLGAVSFLSKASVANPLRRATFVLLVLPSTLALLIAVPISGAALTSSAIQFLHQARVSREGLSTEQICLAVLIVVGAALAFIAVGWILRKGSMWVAGGGQTRIAPTLGNAAPD